MAEKIATKRQKNTMSKRQAKIEALKIASGLCLRYDMGLWDPDDSSITEEDMEKILYALEELGLEFDIRAKRIESGLSKRII